MPLFWNVKWSSYVQRQVIHDRVVGRVVKITFLHHPDCNVPWRPLKS